MVKVAREKRKKNEIETVRDEAGLLCSEQLVSVHKGRGLLSLRGGRAGHVHNAYAASPAYDSHMIL